MTRITSISLMMILLLTACATAGEYKLVKGSQYQLCREYENNLNSFTELEHPMVCERRINPEMTDFREVKWQEIDAKENIHLFDQMLKSDEADKRMSAERYQSLLKTKYLDRAKTGTVKLYTARFDIDNDGKKELVLRAQITGDDWLACTPTNEFTISNGESPVPNLYIMSDEKTLDMEWSKSLHLYSYTASTYQGRTFLSVWSGGSPNIYVPGEGGGRIRVYEPNPLPATHEWVANINVCIYEYHQ